MRTRACSCPLDGISIIIFKRCPALRSQLSKLISACWTQKTFPKSWCRGVITLIHKKGDVKDPANFRPITLQPTMGKIIGACIRNKMWRFIDNNSLIDKTIQKGFWPKINGVTEHVELMKHILKKQKRYNRDIYAVLLDLKNGFGEVHHSLLKFALEYHHIPQDTTNLILSQYSNFGVTVCDKSANIKTEFIRVSRGVLQGDTLSPLLFNMVFNTLIMTLQSPSMQQCGVLWGTGTQRSKWTQFADDAAIFTESSDEAQTLIHLFQRWTNWADLIIRPDKCFAYGASKVNGRYQQIVPRLYVNNTLIPPVAIGDHMTYLGHIFSFSDDNSAAKREIQQCIGGHIEKTKQLHVTPTLQLHALNLLMRAELTHLFRQYSVGVTWVIQQLDNIVSEHARRLLELPPCATMHHLTLPHSLGGFNLTLPSQLYERAQLTTRHSLYQSDDNIMREVFNQTKNPQIDSFIQEDSNSHNSMKNLKNKQLCDRQEQLSELKEQNLLINELSEELHKTEITEWCNHITTLTPSIANFARKAQIRCLATNANLQKWGKRDDDKCPWCAQRETDRHVLSNCTTSLNEGRYTWRHNAVLKEIIAVIQPRLNPSYILYCDLPGYRNPAEVFPHSRPDVAVEANGVYYVLELTCPHELNISQSHEYKMTKYHNLVTINEKPVKLFAVEVTNLGFISRTNIIKFCKELSIKLEKYHLRRACEISLRCSYFIFCYRHKLWPTDVTDPVF